MGFTISQSKDEVQAAQRFQVSAELREVQLLDCAASSSEGKATAHEQMRLGLKMESAVLATADQEARFSVLISIYGDAVDTAAEKDAHTFEVSCRYAVAYSLRPGYTPSQEELDAFKDGNAIFHCWPYTRELIQNLTMRMGLPIPPVPFLRLAPKAEPKKTGKRAPRSASDEASAKG